MVVAASKLDPTDIALGWTGSNSGLRRKATRSGRATTLTSRTLTLTHTPTGVTVSGEIPVGHYSRSDLKRVAEKLEGALIAELSTAVARKLRVPGL